MKSYLVQTFILATLILTTFADDYKFDCIESTDGSNANDSTLIPAVNQTINTDEYELDCEEDDQTLIPAYIQTPDSNNNQTPKPDNGQTPKPNDNQTPKPADDSNNKPNDNQAPKPNDNQTPKPNDYDFGYMNNEKNNQASVKPEESNVSDEERSHLYSIYFHLKKLFGK